MVSLKQYLEQIEDVSLSMVQLSQDRRHTIKGSTSNMRIKLLEKKMKYLVTKVKNFGKKPIKKVRFRLTNNQGGLSKKFETYYVDVSKEDIRISLDIYATSKGCKVEILEILEIPTHIKEIGL